MQRYIKRTLGSVAALALVAAPALAKVGVDEESSSNSGGAAHAPTNGGGSMDGHAGFDEGEGGFTVRSGDGDYKLVVGGRLQARFDYISPDEDVDADDTVTFQVRRARLYFLGNVMGKENTYYVQIAADSPDAYLDFPATDANDFELLDGWLKHEFSEAFSLKGGQFKTPFGRQNLTSSGRLQLPDRALATELQPFDRRDVGIEASGGWNDRKVQYAVAIVNGAGRNTLNLDDDLAYYARLSLNPTGDYGYSEGDVERSESLATTIGVAVHHQPNALGDGGDATRINLDGGLKRNGLSLQGELFWVRTDGETDDDTDSSFYLQGGWFLRPEKAEIVARASRLFFDGDDNDFSEYTFGFNWYSWGHRLKWQAAYSLYDLEVGDVKDNRFLAQAQLWF